MNLVLRVPSLVALVTALHASPLAQDSPFDLEKTKRILTAEIQRELDRGCASVSIALVHGDDVIWTAAFGYSNVWAGTPARPETIYCTGSTFKAVTATALLQLVEAGEILLDDPINDYLGEHRVADLPEHPVTFRHILSHSSGLTAGERTVPLWSRTLPATLEELVAGLKAERPPGERFEYNNSAYALAGYLVERISGTSFEKYVVQNVLAPLGIENRHPVFPYPEQVERLAVPYVVRNGTPTPVARVRYDVFPAGDVYLCAEDMARFLAAHLNGGELGGKRILHEASVEEAHRRQAFDYGLGWVVSEGQPHLIQHGGGVPGFLTYMVGDTEARVGAYVMSNSADMGRIGRAALALLRGEDWTPPRERVAIELAPEVLDRYVGRYRLSAAVELTVTRTGSRMFVQATGQDPTEMFAFAEDEFFLRTVEAEISFRRNERGGVDRLVLHQLGDHEGVRIE